LREFKAVLSHWNSDEYDVALRSIERLRRRTHKATREGVNGWEEGELLGLRATILEDAGDKEAAVRAYLRLAKFYRGHLRQYAHALASALEIAGSAHARVGNRKTAVAVLEEVLRLRSQFPEANPFFEDVVRAAREVRDERNRRLGPMQKPGVTSHKALRRTKRPRGAKAAR
jgi:hypothetical protein